MVTYHDPNDPFLILLAPPLDETPEQCKAREAEEEAARKVSLRIDEELKAEKAAIKKKKNGVKVLVLGQSESGKSTIIKNFQLAYAYQAWLDERASWRSVIYLNLIRSVNHILEILALEMSNQDSSRHGPSPATARSLAHLRHSEESETDVSDDETFVAQPPFAFTGKHKLLKLSLAPLRGVQKDLEVQIGAGASEPEDLSIWYDCTDAAPFAEVERLAARPSNPRRPNEFFIRSNCGWKETLNKLRPRLSTSPDHPNPPQKGKQNSVVEILVGCSANIKSLWTDEVVQAVLKRRNMRLEESSGFFLDDVSRIAARNYEPSDDDVLRARLRTVGVQEYKFKIEKGSEIGRDWYMFDVGGVRTSRAAWFPFFEDCNAIIFMAPISCFDETLEEDHRVNRIKDSILLWKAICSSKLLSKVQFILFLNKCDLLGAKLKRGTSKIQDYFPDFANEHIDVKTIAAYFRHEFKRILKNSTSSPIRPMFAHMTSVTNTKTTAATLTSVRDTIVHNTLLNADFI
ncbi:hypothetical protein PILCRDRAFT_812466 [Piloderma croceum F 1598]|uniref:G-alpha-domain-containing protein n=1 Tax=Piloderma croceum (strain F 1598) TaxID=765440 RepID=A0A0C3GG84_PILCF|nr:hypothetical protein PILCRDRAFT_812466 [Piloderma croceum F 1598]